MRQQELPLTPATPVSATRTYVEVTMSGAQMRATVATLERLHEVGGLEPLVLATLKTLRDGIVDAERVATKRHTSLARMRDR